jgi:hypothetical protein
VVIIQYLDFAAAAKHTLNPSEPSCQTMNELPKEVLQNIANYLPASTVTNLTCTSKQIHSQLQLNITPSLNLLRHFIKSDRNDLINYGFDIPIPPSTVSIHTLFLTMQWRDQGWGNLKGRVLILAKSTRGTRVVYASNIAPHTEQTLQIAIHNPQDYESYHLCYIVGGGGGHELNLYFIEMKALVIDEGKTIVRAFQILSAVLPHWNVGYVCWNSPTSYVCLLNNVASDHLMLLLASVRYLLLHDQAMLPPLVEY